MLSLLLRRALPALPLAVCPVGFFPVLAAQSFQDVSAGSGLQLVTVDQLEFGHGMCAEDFDGDGDLDLVIPQNRGEPVLYFRNIGGMRFQNDTRAAGLGLAADVKACQAVDYDNDGDKDLFVGNLFGALQLFENDGGAHFTEVGVGRGLAQGMSNYGLSFADYDNDGWVDLYVGNRVDVPGQPQDNVLYRNVFGTFFDVTSVAGVADPGSPTFFGMFFDYDEDGWQDLYICNDKGGSFNPNELFRNNGDGTFSAVGALVGASDRIDAMGMDVVDAFNDGGWDFYVSDLNPDHMFKVWDPALGSYVDETYRFGVQGGEVGWAVHFTDFDNDGWQDLHVVQMTGANLIFRNPAQPHAAGVQWPLVNNRLALSYLQTSAICADFDDDGMVDILHRLIFDPGNRPPAGVALHRGVPGAGTGHWLDVRLRGSQSNRDGLGTVLTVRANGVTQRQMLRHGQGFLSGGPLSCHFGTGLARYVDVELRWPSGQRQQMLGVPTDQRLTIDEPAVRVEGLTASGARVTLAFDCPHDRATDYLFAISLTPGATPLPGGRTLPLQIDELTSFALLPGNGVMSGGFGPLGRDGQARAQLQLPVDPAVRGIVVHAAGLTWTPARGTIDTVINAALSFTIL